MDDTDDRRSEYYKTISREFLRRRGAPLDLSPRDLSLIAEWERRKIPLDVVLDGIKAGFEHLRRKPGRGKRFSLAFCAGFVDREEEKSRDRKVGRGSAGGSRSEKIGEAREEVERFLGSMSSDSLALSSFFRKGLEVLSASPPDEEALAELDDEIDAALWKQSSSAEREKWRKISERELDGKAPDRDPDFVRRILVKGMRDRHRIPYLSLFYY